MTQLLSADEIESGDLSALLRAADEADEQTSDRSAPLAPETEDPDTEDPDTDTDTDTDEPDNGEPGPDASGGWLS